MLRIVKLNIKSSTSVLLKPDRSIWWSNFNIIFLNPHRIMCDGQPFQILNKQLVIASIVLHTGAPNGNPYMSWQTKFAWRATSEIRHRCANMNVIPWENAGGWLIIYLIKDTVTFWACIARITTQLCARFSRK